MLFGLVWSPIATTSRRRRCEGGFFLNCGVRPDIIIIIIIDLSSHFPFHHYLRSHRTARLNVIAGGRRILFQQGLAGRVIVSNGNDDEAKGRPDNGEFARGRLERHSVISIGTGHGPVA